MKQLQERFEASKQTYGSQRLQAEVQAGGLVCGRKRVMRLTHHRGINAQRKPHHCKTPDSEHSLPAAPNH